MHKHLPPSLSALKYLLSSALLLVIFSHIALISSKLIRLCSWNLYQRKSRWRLGERIYLLLLFVWLWLMSNVQREIDCLIDWLVDWLWGQSCRACMLLVMWVMLWVFCTREVVREVTWSYNADNVHHQSSLSSWGYMASETSLICKIFFTKFSLNWLKPSLRVHKCSKASS